MSKTHEKIESSTSLSIPQRFRPYLEWLGVVVAIVGTLLALSAFLFPAIVSVVGDSLAGTLEPVARRYPVVGAVVVLVALWSLHRVQRTNQTPDDETPSERGNEMVRQLHLATTARYRCRTNQASEAIDQYLFEGAVRAVRTRQGADIDRAREAVRSGQWTDDPIAAAFLADERPYPIRAWLYGHIDPGGAYQRRVRRTLDAIDTVQHSGDER